MKNYSLLVLMGKSGRSADIEGLVELARTNKHFISVIMIGEAPAFPYYSDGLGQYGATVMVGDWQKDFENENAALGKTAKSIQQYLTSQQIAHNVSIVCAEAAAIADAIARWAMVCDLVLVSNDLRRTAALFDVAVQAALFRAPAGVVLNGMASPSSLAPKRVLVAWRPTKASSRAVHAAMPILRGAKEVTLVIVDPIMTVMRDGEDPGADAARWLSHQGCKVTVQQTPSGGHDIGDVLIKCARERDAELIVMGGYDHSRLREIVFGGTTRRLVEQPDLAVFMAH